MSKSRNRNGPYFGGAAWDEPQVELPKAIGEYTEKEVLEMHSTLLQQDALLERLTKAAIEYSRIVDFEYDDKVEKQKLVLQGGRVPLLVDRPTDIEVALGDWVIVATDTKQIVAKSYRGQTGEIVTISRVYHSDQMAEVGGITGSRLLHYDGYSQDAYPPEVGEEWLCDSGTSILLHKIEKPTKQVNVDFERVYWDSIGGLASVKQELQESLMLLRRESDIADVLGIRQPKGILLYGPPGNGKTMLGKAVATDLSSNGAGYDPAFIYIKGPEILSKFVGVSEERIRNLFLEAKRHWEKNGVPAVIFIDECDAVMNMRGSGRSSDVERTIVPAFLTEMDGIEANHAFIILATNRPDTLDPAIVREGRIDKHIEVGKPDYDAVISIVERHLMTVPFKGALPDLAAEVAMLIQSHHNLSGAFVVSILERAKRLTMRRAYKESVRKPYVCLEDLMEAARGAMEERK